MFDRKTTILLAGLITCLNVSCRKETTAPVTGNPVTVTNIQSFAVTGVVKELRPDSRTIVIKHQPVTNYMEAMTMPFKVKGAEELAGLQTGDEISFRLLVDENESWIDRVIKTGRSFPVTNLTVSAAANGVQSAAPPSLLDFKFTNEFGRPVSFNDFKGQAVAFTFFFTRCPIPEYCPRLMKNFSEVSQKLKAMPNAPTNWQLLAISFDTAFDTPEILRVYARQYDYDTNHWTFLTGTPDKIAELAHASGVTYKPDGTSFNHDFRTLVLDTRGRLQMNFPIGGNLSDLLVGEILKAAAVTNH